MATLEEIRAKLLAQEEKRENKGGTGDRAMFPFWNTPDDKTSLIRFLPDANPDNMFFWEERVMIRLPFQGVKGEHNNPVTVSVPCMEMYGKTCPILAETRPWWKDDSLVEMARRYWKKRSYIFQGFVVDSPFEETDKPENPIRRFTINKSIFDKIKASLMDSEMEDLPIDFTSGRDFKIIKTKKGQFANYDTSAWSMKTRSLSSEELAAIEEYGLFNLRDYLPKEPTEAELAVIMDMFRASVEDQAYDPAKWSEYYRPYGVSATASVNSTSSTKVENTDDEEEEVKEEKTSSTKQDPREILNRIRNKSKN